MFKAISQHGNLVFDEESGVVDTCESEYFDTALSAIIRFDLVEYRLYYSRHKDIYPDGGALDRLKECDILDLGYWYLTEWGDRRYEEPEWDWRAENIACFGQDEPLEGVVGEAVEFLDNGEIGETDDTDSGNYDSEVDPNTSVAGERLSKVFRGEQNSDTSDPSEEWSWLLYKYQHGSEQERDAVDWALMTICGWTMASLCTKARVTLPEFD